MENSDDIKKLKLKIAALEKTNQVLMDRVEQTVSQLSDSFSLFQKNGMLQNEIEKKTHQLQKSILEVDRHKRAINEALIISETNEFGQITFANEKFYQISGYTPEEILGKTHNIINSGHHSEEFWSQFWQTLKDKKTFRGEICNRNKNGEEYWVDSTVYPILDDKNEIKGFTSVRVDITEKRLNQLKSHHNDKLASIGSLAAGVGHEINNPLTIVMFNLDFVMRTLKKDPIDFEKIVAKIESAQTALKRIQKITEGLRVYSRANNESQEKISLSKVIHSTIDFVTSIYRSQGIEVSAELPPDYDYLVLANSGRLEQVLMNLITNARDATEGKPERLIKIQLEKISSKDVLISVTDNGTGIPNHLIHKIREPFFTTKGPQKGTGIGLGIVSEFVSQINGRLEIKSEMGKGSTFQVFLPLDEEVPLNSDIESKREASTNQLRSFIGRVLVVDDEDEIQNILGKMFSDAGFQVDYADDGTTALEFIKLNSYNYILTDLRMKIMNGDELIRQSAKLKDFNSIFLIISGAAESLKLEDFKEAKKYIGGTFKKPFDADELLNRIVELNPKKAV